MDPTIRPFLSGELPVMSESITELVFMIDEGKSMDKIYDALCRSDMVTSVADPNGWVGGKRFRVLFHTLSRDLLRSLLLKTLGPDLWSKVIKADNWRRVFPPEGAGCYACFIYIHDRRGKFLCSNEIRQVISELEAYEQVVDTYQRREGHDQPLTDEQKEDYKKAMKVDDVLRTEEHWDLEHPRYDLFIPRFMSSTTKSGAQYSHNISALIEMLKKRCEYTTDPYTYHRQSPLLVGNSRNVAKRAENHMIGGGFSNSPKVWGLLLSCMKLLELECRTSYVTLFRTWRDDAQVNQAEVLGTILAGSMINEDGLNVKEPGTRIESGAWTPNNYGDASDIVFVDTPWTRENLRHSIAARTPAITDANKQKLDELHEEIAKNDDDLKEGATALRTKKAELDEAKARYREAKVTAEADLATGEEMLKEMEDLFQEGQDLVPSR